MSGNLHTLLKAKFIKAFIARFSLVLALVFLTTSCMAGDGQPTAGNPSVDSYYSSAEDRCNFRGLNPGAGYVVWEDRYWRNATTGECCTVSCQDNVKPVFQDLNTEGFSEIDKSNFYREDSFCTARNTMSSYEKGCTLSSAVH